jgi:hypothetical protein
MSIIIISVSIVFIGQLKVFPAPCITVKINPLKVIVIYLKSWLLLINIFSYASVRNQTHDQMDKSLSKKNLSLSVSIVQLAVEILQYKWIKFKIIYLFILNDHILITKLFRKKNYIIAINSFFWLLKIWSLFLFNNN